MNQDPESAQRAAYHRAFAHWLDSCSTEDLDCLDQLQALHPSPTVRSMMSFIKDCLADPVRHAQLPQSLVQRLQDENWQPAKSVCATA